MKFKIQKHQKNLALVILTMCFTITSQAAFASMYYEGKGIWLGSRIYGAGPADAIMKCDSFLSN